MELEVIDGKLDIQIQEALNDISNSFKMIENLSDPGLVYMYDTKSLIRFHKIRIKNCLDALSKIVKVEWFKN